MSASFENGTQVKMIDFITSLYQKYKLLSQLSERQSNRFQNQIVSLLVDQEQNVDPQALEKVIDENGIEAFLIQVLGNVIQRPAVKNMGETSKNNLLAVQNIKKEQTQLQKKNKILERKQERLRTTQEQLLTVCKQKITLMQSQSMKKLAAKQVQIKKSINNLLNQLKTKEKMVLQKLQIVKSNKSTLKMIEQKERNINDKLKLLQKRQKQLKSKDDSQLLIKKDSQIQDLTELNNKLKETIKELSSKYKNMELAYRKLKNDNQKLINQKCMQTKQTNKNSDKVQKKIEFDNLQISLIKPQPYQHVLSAETIEMLKAIPSMISIANEKNQVATVLSAIINIQPTQFFENVSKNADQSQQQIQFLKLQACSQDPHEHLINQIHSLNLQNQQQRDLFLKNKTLEKWFQKASQLRYPMAVSSQLLQIMLPLFQNNGQTDKIMDGLSNGQIINHIQKVYLCHQTNEEIAETTTLILSRIKLWKQEVTLLDSFRRAIQIRKRLQAQSSLLYLNIKHLL